MAAVMAIADGVTSAVDGPTAFGEAASNAALLVASISRDPALEAATAAAAVAATPHQQSPTISNRTAKAANVFQVAAEAAQEAWKQAAVASAGAAGLKAAFESRGAAAEAVREALSFKGGGQRRGGSGGGGVDDDDDDDDDGDDLSQVMRLRSRY
jgi:hypothetical protein